MAAAAARAYLSHMQPIRRPLVIAAVMAALFVIAIEATIVATAMPQIAASLGDLHLYAWVFSSFLLAQTATTVIFGKLADLYGRRPVILAGLAVFTVGSLFCGTAHSMLELILWRLVQGVGAGAIQPVAVTVVGDLYPAEERGRVQGWLASIWGVSSVLGPLAGALIVTRLGWAWVFWINIPVCALAAVGFVLFLHENVRAGPRAIDAAGAALFAVAIAALMTALTEAGAAGSRGVVAVAVAVFVAAAVLFALREHTARDPMIDVRLWGRRLLATANLATLSSGMAIIGLTTFLPMYVQAVLGRSPLVAGFTLTVMVLGWPVGATVAARNFHRFGLRPTLLAGAALLPVGAAGFLLLRPGGSPLLAGAGSIVMGLGMGFLSTAAIVMVQGSVGWAERGAATASNLFARNLGSTLGAASLGALLDADLSGAGPAAFDRVRRLLDGGGVGLPDAATRLVLAHALHATFEGVFALAAVTLALALAVPAVALAARPSVVTVEGRSR